MGPEHDARENRGESADDLSDAEIAGLHEVELGIEHFRRAHGHLVAFHHATGRGMDHLADAEADLRDAGHEALADELRDHFLPRGVMQSTREDDHGRWSYDVIETYEEVFLNDVVTFGDAVAEQVADGRRHVKERHQEREWKRRADRG